VSVRREVKHTFKSVGTQAVSLSQTVVSTGNIKQIELSVVVKVRQHASTAEVGGRRLKKHARRVVVVVVVCVRSAGAYFTGWEQTAAVWTGVCFVSSPHPHPSHATAAFTRPTRPNSPIFRLCTQYVRREIRQLTDKDREAFFDAMEKLYRLPTAEGEKLYGEDYKVRAASTTAVESKQFWASFL